MLTSEAAVVAEIIDAVAAELRLPKEQITAASDLAADLGADSLDALNIAIRLEKTYQIKIPDAALSACRTVGDIATQVAALLNGGGNLPAEGATH